MHDGQNFLCLKYVVGRTTQTNASFPLIEAESKGRIDILFISDPTEELPSARTEVSRIMENVRSDFIAADVLEGKNATIDRLIELLMSKEHERLEVLHFAGHVEYNKEKPEESSILLNDDGPKVDCTAIPKELSFVETDSLKSQSSAFSRIV
jgi:CHAT domain-containing protein